MKKFEFMDGNEIRICSDFIPTQLLPKLNGEPLTVNDILIWLVKLQELVTVNARSCVYVDVNSAHSINREDHIWNVTMPNIVAAPPFMNCRPQSRSPSLKLLSFIDGLRELSMGGFGHDYIQMDHPMASNIFSLAIIDADLIIYGRNKG